VRIHILRVTQSNVIDPVLSDDMARPEEVEPIGVCRGRRDDHLWRILKAVADLVAFKQMILLTDVDTYTLPARVIRCLTYCSLPIPGGIYFFCIAQTIWRWN